MVEINPSVEPVEPGSHRLAAWAALQRCPACGHEGLVIDWREVVAAQPVGTFSLSGAQAKVAAIASSVPWIRCPHCGVEAKGKPA